VLIASRKREACEGVAEEIRQRGGRAHAFACDIARSTDIAALADASMDRFGRVDVLVANAAVNIHAGPLATLSGAALEHLLRANVLSTLDFCNRLCPGMAAAGGGSVIVVSSVGALRGSATLGGYSITKAADIQLARSLAIEWGHARVRVNVLAPGLVKTDFAKPLWGNPMLGDRLVAATPLRRIGEPADICGAALLLASDAGAFITGEVIVIDGGLTIGGLP
jgi:NAD(P)-dependent dehydrogenase (short-subunit alcohol dehydrogenase family)